MAEVTELKEYFTLFGDRLPAEMERQRKLLEERVGIVLRRRGLDGERAGRDDRRHTLTKAEFVEEMRVQAGADFEQAMADVGLDQEFEEHGPRLVAQRHPLQCVLQDSRGCRRLVLADRQRCQRVERIGAVGGTYQGLLQ